MRPRLLDLFCGAGGAAMGYHRAGFDVVGVDRAPQPRYPFRFARADALEYLVEHGADYDAIHASPPCQQYSVTRTRHKHIEYPDLLGPTRDALVALGKPWVIENVPGAPFGHYVELCGMMFGLRVYRHRRFETSWLVMPLPSHPPHLGPPVCQRGRKAAYEAGGFVTITGDVGSYCGPAMGIDWMTGNELSQAIPPAYCEWIGHRLLTEVAAQETAA